MHVNLLLILNMTSNICVLWCRTHVSTLLMNPHLVYSMLFAHMFCPIYMGSHGSFTMQCVLFSHVKYVLMSSYGALCNRTQTSKFNLPHHIHHFCFMVYQ
jgi:hypothetical protein